MDMTSVADDAVLQAASNASGPRGARRLAIVRWLRHLHGWIGLWGAILGLLFGVSGVLLNHRAVMRFPSVQTEERNLQLRLPSPAPANANAMVDWVRGELRLGDGTSRVREERTHSVPWGDRTLMQPTRWTANLATPWTTYQVEYFVGNDFVAVRTGEGNFLAMLNNLHKGVGGGVAWVLLADTIGGAMVLLSLTGVLLWSQLHRKRLAGLAIFIVSTALTIALATAAM